MREKGDNKTTSENKWREETADARENGSERAGE